jgi:Sulfatase
VWDRAVVVVTADHGAAFTPGAGFRQLDDRNQPEILGVPLFVHAQGIAPGVDDTPAQTVDVVPTLAGLLHVHIPWPVDGRDLVGGVGAPRASHPVGLSGDFGGSASVSNRRVDGHLAALLRLAAARPLPAPRPDATRSLVAWGPHPEWLGQPAPARATDAQTARVELDWPSADVFRAPLGASPPLELIGHAPGVRAGAVIVFAIDGRVAAIASTYSDQGETHFLALLDSRAVQPGRHTVVPYLVRSGALDDALRLPLR